MCEHTKTPWHTEIIVSHTTGEPVEISICGADSEICQIELGEDDESCHANAAFIVTAVNKHEAIVKALTDIIAANKYFRAGMPDDWEGDPLQDPCNAAAKLLHADVSSPTNPPPKEN